MTLKPDDFWIADRNFRTVEFTCGIDSRGGLFVIREHKNYPSKIIGKQKYIGKVETGKVYEQLISVIDGPDREHTLRRIRVAFNIKTGNGDTDIYIISNLSKSTATNAKKIAELYRDLWTIETAFSISCRALQFRNKYVGRPTCYPVCFLCRSCFLHHSVCNEVCHWLCAWN